MIALEAGAALADRKPRKGSEAARIYQAIRDRILNVQFPPGSELDETSLERMFHVSRTPVREALARLASEGLVVTEPNRAAIVAPLGIDTIRQFFESFDLVQRAVTRWSAVRRTAEQLSEIERLRDEFSAAAAEGDPVRMNAENNRFHAAIGRACGNDYLSGFYQRLLGESHRLAQITFSYSRSHDGVLTEHIQAILAEHDAVAAAIRAGDADAAERLAHAHAMLFRSQIEAHIRRSLTLDIA